MNRWKKALEEHPVHETLSWLDNAASKTIENLSEGQIEEQRRLKKIIERYRSVLASVDPETVPANQIDSLNSQLRHQNITNQVNAYLQNGKTEHLTSINDLISAHLVPLSLLQPLSEKTASQDDFSYIDSVVDSTINGLAAKRAALEDQLENLSLLSDEQIKKLEALSIEIDQKQAELTKLSSDWQSQFSAAQESRSQEFTKWRDNFAAEKSKKIQEIIDNQNKYLEDQRTRMTGDLDQIIEDSKTKHQSILDLYELTAGDSVGAAYIKSANDERSQANRWRGVSVFFIAVTVIWLIFGFFYNAERWDIFNSAPDIIASQDENVREQPNQEIVINSETNSNLWQKNRFPWHIMLITFSISGVLLWGAAYSAQQSTTHRNNEKRARWFALEVKAFDPFISSLDPQQQQDLKRRLAERIFGQNSKTDEDSKIIEEHALRVVTDAFGKLLSKLPK
ncbi:MAG: hypothetical protein JKY26_00010 [Pseudomonas sp.]|nr:hypothetical protein [Pseudomonas sp.]